MDARTERLSIKLQELASKQLPRDANMADVEGNITGNQNEDQICDTKSGNDLNINEKPAITKQGSGATRPSDTNPIPKRTKRKKRSSIGFAKNLGHARRIRQKS